jgi:hypothetical protein
MKTVTPFKDRTPEDVYLDWLNNFVSLQAMAEYYEVSFNDLYIRVKEGRKQYRAKYDQFP